jgi:exopolyphosphatase/guanosine-5'-triphosphate,3'-diphosphate pyrophosphatase
VESERRATDGSAAHAGRHGPRVAVIDLGTNSTRLMVADVTAEGEVMELVRETRVTRLGRGVDLTGRLSDDGIETVCAAVADYVATIHPLEPDHVVAIGTSAVRDAANGDAFLAELRERFPLSPRVIDGETEARLTFAGATAARPDRDACILVADIGGGSTELVTGCGGEVEFWTSLQAGVVRQTERHISGDPPQATELEALANEVRSTVIDEIAASSPPSPDVGIAVAGTPTSLAAIELELVPYDSSRVEGHELTMESIQRSLSRLASIPTAERFRVPGLQPERAPTIVAGVVILIQVMRAFGLHRIEVSERDILHGAALDAAANPAPAR